jgi:hypothetical protein
MYPFPDLDKLYLPLTHYYRCIGYHVDRKIKMLLADPTVHISGQKKPEPSNAAVY